MGKSKDHPLGGVFGIIGFIIGIALGVDIGLGFFGTIIVAFIAASFGMFVERVVARVLAFAAAILYLLIRNQIIEWLFDALSK